MRERRLSVRRTARVCVRGPDEGPSELWFVLHGYRQLADRFLRRFEPLDDGTRLIVAPEALSRFYVEREMGRHGPGSLVGGSWMTRHERDAEIDDYVAYLDRVAEDVLERCATPPASTTVLGFSQGLHTAARWAVRGAHRLDRLVLWGDTVPPDLDLDRASVRLAGTEILLVVGDADRTRRPEVEEERLAALRGVGLTPRVLRHPGGHEIEPELLERIAAGE